MLNKKILIQYRSMTEEIKDIRRRIQKVRQSLDDLDVVADTVMGTRPDGIYGSIRIEGYPVPEYGRKRAALEKYHSQLTAKEAELAALTSEAEEYIETIEMSDLRLMLRLYYIDGLSWVQVAHRMNKAFPHKKIRYTDENLRKRAYRFFEEQEEQE